MVRGKDPMWKYAEELNPGFKCKFCGFESRATITRFKWHLAQIEVQGIKPCTAALPMEVQQEVRLAIGDTSRKRKTLSSFTIEEVMNAPSTSSWRPNTVGVEHPIPRAVDRTCEVQGVEEVGQGSIFPHVDIGNHMDILTAEPSQIRGNAFLTKKLEGKMFQKNMDKILSLLTRDCDLSIGIYGIGGVGKTELMMQVCNKLLQIPNTDSHVYWVPVSPNSSIFQLQNGIAKAIGLDISSEDNESKRAEKLLQALGSKKFVLVLDNVWDYIPLESVGIPIAMNGCKLVLTTRSIDICRKTDCDEIIVVEPLSDVEAWNLFKANLGRKTTLHPKIEEIAKSIADECGGLPLGIISMARSMRAVTKIGQWRNALSELRRHIPRQDNMEVFQKLKLSYDHLNDSSLRRCFLYCALFPNFSCSADELIEFLIDDGIIEGTGSRRTTFNKGCTMLDTLANVGLLSIDDDNFLEMNSLIGDIAIKILRMNATVMVEAGKNLKEVPEQENWTEDLVRVSLVGNNFKEIPSSHSPRCPNLKSLFLSYNENFESIEDSFFKHLCGLKILDLSSTNIQCLPNSISDLVNLESLLLQCCRKLKYVPSLGKLRVLRRLDLRHSGLEKLPEGIELLTNLRYLNLYDTQLELQAEILRKLSNLQFLGLGSNEIPIEEVACLKKLEVLCCWIKDVVNFNYYVQSLEMLESTMGRDVEEHLLCKYNICVSENMGRYSFIDMDRFTSLENYQDFNFNWRVIFAECGFNRGGEESQPIIPENMECLTIYNCSSGRSLLWLEDATQLKYLCIVNLDGLECLAFSSPFIFQELEVLLLSRLNNLAVLIEGGVSAAPSSYPSIASFSCLRIIYVGGCPNITKLLPLGLLKNLQYLKEIRVIGCERMEEIIATEDDDQRNTATRCILPNLQRLKLYFLRELKTICSVQMVCDSLEEFDVFGCPKLTTPLVFKNGERWFSESDWEGHVQTI